MKKIRFIHTADWHIRDIQYGRTFRGEDSRRAVRQVVDFAIKTEVDFIINGGDILDRNRPSGAMLDFMFEVDVALRKAGIPMYCVTGNHDESSPSFLNLPGYLQHLDMKASAGLGGRGGIVCIDGQEVVHGGIRIHGFPACRWEEVANTVVLDRQESPDILVWHGAVQEFQPFGVDLTLKEVFEVPFKAALLGDLHIHVQARGPEEQLLAYPGSTELTERGESAEKFFDLYELDEGWRDRPFPDPVAIPIETRPVLFLRADSDERADECVAKVRDLAGLDDHRLPLVFLSYNWDQRSVVGRISSCLDRSKTVFRYKVLSPTFGGSVYETQEREVGVDAVKPRLLEVVDKVVHPGNPLNLLTRELADPEANAREILTKYVDSRLSEDQEVKEA